MVPRGGEPKSFGINRLSRSLAHFAPLGIKDLAGALAHSSANEVVHGISPTLSREPSSRADSSISLGSISNIRPIVCAIWWRCCL